MRKVAKFTKVSFEQFMKDCEVILGDVYLDKIKMECLAEKYNVVDLINYQNTDLLACL